MLVRLVDQRGVAQLREKLIEEWDLWFMWAERQSWWLSHDVAAAWIAGRCLEWMGVVESQVEDQGGGIKIGVKCILLLWGEGLIQWRRSDLRGAATQNKINFNHFSPPSILYQHTPWVSLLYSNGNLIDVESGRGIWRQSDCPTRE